MNTNYFSMKPLMFILMLAVCGYATAQERKAPSYPLITHNPNFSIWSNTDDLTASATAHWTGADHSMLGLIEVNGVTYRFMGNVTPNYKTILPASDETIYTVQYTESQPQGDWKAVRYTTEGWKSGGAPIGDLEGKAKTFWRSDEIWVRRTFDIADPAAINALFLKLNHDDNIDVYLNGKPIYSKRGWTNKLEYIVLTDEHKKELRSGQNVIAAYLRNTAGGRFLDFGLVDHVINESAKIEVAKQKSVEITATQTTYHFSCGEIDLKVTFTSPLLLDDLDQLARPVSYITYQAQSNDNKTHDVKIYFSAASDIAVYTPDQKVVASNQSSSTLNILKVGTIDQPILQKGADDMRIDWGHFYVGVPKISNAIQFVTQQKEAATAFTNNLTTTTATEGRQLALNTVIPFGAVGKNAVSHYVALAYDEIYSIQYFGDNLRPWWNRYGKETIEEQLILATAAYPNVMTTCSAVDKAVYADAYKAGGQEYADLCVLAYRQSIAAHTLVQSPKGELLWLSKENNSGGFINTVDVTYPSSPLYLLYNPQLLEGMLTGIFYFSESGKYPHPWAAHDLGTYPWANGQTYGEPMPVEESGNMIILTAAIAKAQGNASFAKKHWNILGVWADYLTREGLDPKNQLCTDDFAGHLARNANLSIKAIVGIACYAQLAEMLGHGDIAQKYRAVAEAMVPKWMEMADAGDHYALTFDNKNSWSQKYNLIWDKVLDLDLFPQEVYDKEIAYYLKRQNRYGLPLDSRKDYTKNDWILWTATFTNTEDEFKSLIKPVYRHALETESRIPLNDFYDSKTGIRENFKARSVVGGFYMKMFANKLKGK